MQQRSRSAALQPRIRFDWNDTRWFGRAVNILKECSSAIPSSKVSKLSFGRRLRLLLPHQLHQLIRIDRLGGDANVVQRDRVKHLGPDVAGQHDRRDVLGGVGRFQLADVSLCRFACHGRGASGDVARRECRDAIRRVPRIGLVGNLLLRSVRPPQLSAPCRMAVAPT